MEEPSPGHASKRLLKDWIHNGELNEIAVRVMAKYQLEPMKVGVPRKAPYYEILDDIKKAADGDDPIRR